MDSVAIESIGATVVNVGLDANRATVVNVGLDAKGGAVDSVAIEDTMVSIALSAGHNDQALSALCPFLHTCL